MPIIKTPPRIVLDAPPFETGKENRVEVTLVCEAPVPVRSVDLVLVGKVRRIELFGAVTTTVARIPVTVVSEATELDEGEHRFSATLTVPAGMPGSVSTLDMSVRWEVIVAVRIPWWPDRVKTFPVKVIPLGQPAVAEGQVSALCDYRGPSGHGPWAEVSLESPVANRAGVFAGHVRLANTAFNRYFVMLVSLRRLTIVGRRVVTETVATRGVRLLGVTDGTALPFHLNVPRDAFPGFSHPAVSVRWVITCQIDASSPWRPEVSIPVDVRPYLKPSGHWVAGRAVRAIGGDHRRQLWTQVAVDTGFEYVDDYLWTRIDDAILSIGIDGRALAISHLLANLQMREVDIGLQCAFNTLRCRDHRHTVMMSRATVGLDYHSDALRSASDRHVTIASYYPLFSRQYLALVVARLRQLAYGIVRTRAALPAPRAVEHLEPLFRDAARRLMGQYEPAGMDVWGRREDMPFSLETRWGRRDLLCTALTVSPLVPISARHQGRWEPHAWPAEPPKGVGPLLHGAIGLAINAERIELYLPPAPTDGQDVVMRMEGLIAAGLRMSMRGGVYR